MLNSFKQLIFIVLFLIVCATCVPQAVLSASMNASVKCSHTVFNVPLLGLNNCSDLLQCRDLWPRTSYLNSACCKNKIPLASVHDEHICTTKSRNDFNYSSSEFFDVTNAFRLLSFFLRMLLREFFRRTLQESVSGDWPLHLLELSFYVVLDEKIYETVLLLRPQNIY